MLVNSALVKLGQSRTARLANFLGGESDPSAPQLRQATLSNDPR
jgi:hypothetical protein